MTVVNITSATIAANTTIQWNDGYAQHSMKLPNALAPGGYTLVGSSNPHATPSPCTAWYFAPVPTPSKAQGF
jgi:hypothetical protein